LVTIEGKYVKNRCMPIFLTKKKAPALFFEEKTNHLKKTLLLICHRKSVMRVLIMNALRTAP